MTFLESLGLNENVTPGDLRATIERRVRESLEQGLLDSRAATEAVAFTRGNANAWLVGSDPFVARAMAEATSGVGFKTDPEKGRAVLVLSNDLHLHEFTDQDVPYGYRWWRYADSLPEGRVCATGSDAICHRCGPTVAMTDENRLSSVAWVFHIARGPYVVEFAMCADCQAYYARLADNERIWSGDTYIELKDHGDGTV
ncbi:hypothetical protein LVJ59_02810 [Microbacterium sp. KKR3/1]|uniref:hypothetical protein n=1 Tax=Microbacterium sp. KKR3/1 TaxID=2904241 RepID=UPI001E40D0A7|nr:hypothetical protein [Microbacterium sp. KKR3/1]MCE0507955.1 hypothetical protein [Microbacterium sp. KKR3/1]